MLMTSSIKNASLKYLSNKPDDERIITVLNTNDYFAFEELQYRLIKKELTMTEEHKVNEDLVAAKWKSRMIARYMTRTEISLNTKEVRTIRTDEVSDYG